MGTAVWVGVGEGIDVGVADGTAVASSWLRGTAVSVGGAVSTIVVGFTVELEPVESKAAVSNAGATVGKIGESVLGAAIACNGWGR